MRNFDNLPFFYITKKCFIVVTSIFNTVEQSKALLVFFLRARIRICSLYDDIYKFRKGVFLFSKGKQIQATEININKNIKQFHSKYLTFFTVLQHQGYLLSFCTEVANTSGQSNLKSRKWIYIKVRSQKSCYSVSLTICPLHFLGEFIQFTWEKEEILAGFISKS